MKFDIIKQEVIDIAKVLTPLRYPGGKSSIYGLVNKIIEDNNINDFTYVEPYAGGFGLGIKLLLDGTANRVIINELDYSIYSFWYSVVNHTVALCELIYNTPITIEEWHIQKHIFENPNLFSVLQVGFSTLFLNRCNRSGILKAGPIGGFNQNGNYLIDCRFNKDTIINRIQAIAEHRDRIEIYNLDAIDLIENHLINRNDNLFINFDPPYVSQGSGLYINYYVENDHIELSNVIRDNLNNVFWMITYDDHPLIHQCYEEYQITNFKLNYSAQTKRVGTELLILNNNLNYIIDEP